MHVGWTFLLAVALFLAFKDWRFRPLFFVIPLAMFSATIVTGNHYFLDGVLGLVVAVAALRISLFVRDRSLDGELAAPPQAPNSS
jgi:membrane-associated phospholipid phosphatase